MFKRMIAVVSVTAFALGLSACVTQDDLAKLEAQVQDAKILATQANLNAKKALEK